MSDNEIFNGLDLDENEMAPDLISLVDEEGTEYMFEILDSYDMDDHQYIAVAPYHENAEDTIEDSGELTILKTVEEDGEEPYLVPIDNEDEFNRISEIFIKRLEEYYDIIDETPDPEE